jgi:putative tryptophan/tyrosine transport system substrate-binding protein
LPAYSRLRAIERCAGKFKESHLDSRRRLLLTLGASALTAPLISFAQQQGRVWRLGFLGVGFPAQWTSRVDALRAGLRNHGYVEGKNIQLEFRWAEDNYERLNELAAQLVRQNVDVLLTYGTPGTLAAKRATETTPIVMVHSGDAVATGLISSLAKPGGNLTGSTLLNSEFMAKRIELLKELLPRMTKVGVLLNSDNELGKYLLKAMQSRAASLNVSLYTFESRTIDEMESVVSAMVQKQIDAVVVSEDAIFIANGAKIGQLLIKNKIISAGYEAFAAAGGMIGYGANYLETYRHAAVFVDKILKGTKPADIPVQQPTKFELVINMRTAKALGSKIPQSILVQATKVIE